MEGCFYAFINKIFLLLISVIFLPTNKGEIENSDILISNNLYQSAF